MKKFDEINIIPFIDIMLVLLAIVLITASFISQGKIQVNVPKASSTVAFRSDDFSQIADYYGKW
ncbi:biopolymer transport protein [Pasteurella multocida subsp. multocida str. Anand1_cattle]|nr:biopolymer transport protein [Pasteurella multocida subsp. multocida str. Anand1_cattle]